MNKDQIKGSSRAAAGKLQKQAGKALGSAEHQAKGTMREAAGKTQKSYGDMKEGAKRRSH